MSSAEPSAAARVLIVTSEEVLARSLDTILAQAGFSVAQVFTAADALEIARHDSPPPDAFILDLLSADVDGLSLCGALRAQRRVNAATPIVLITPRAGSRQMRLDALRAGASDLRSGVLDAEEFVLDLHARLAAKFSVDQARAEGLTDTATGAYNTKGLERRANEVVAAAARHQAVFACAAFAPEEPVPATDLADLGDKLGIEFYRQARTSDALARVGPAEFVVLAPETDAKGAARLALRLAAAVESSVNANGKSRVRLRAASYALAAPPVASLDPLMPVARARAALGTIQPT
ncbi:MAG TPA: response regulator [Gemmatimonadales bacterium]|nr:response regulator [Gemmatimonadales bacterium]